MGKGNFTLDDGTQIEAGRFNTNKTGSFGEFNFSQGFQDAPVVLAGVTSFNETKHRKYSIQLVDANRDLTYRAAKLKAIYHIAYADCFAAALSLKLKATVVTGDPEFEKLSHEVTIYWIP